MAKDKKKDKKNKDITVPTAELLATDINPNAVLLGEDIMVNKPKRNTVIIILSKQERDNMRAISEQMDAISDSNDVPYAKALEVREAWRNAWAFLFDQNPTVCPAWPMRVDFFTGLVYISE